MQGKNYATNARIFILHEQGTLRTYPAWFRGSSRGSSSTYPRPLVRLWSIGSGATDAADPDAQLCPPTSIPDQLN